MLVQLSPQFSILCRTDVPWPSGDRARLHVSGLSSSLLVAFDRLRADAEDASGLRLRRPLVHGAKQVRPEVVGICAHDDTSMRPAYSSSIHLKVALGNPERSVEPHDQVYVYAAIRLVWDREHRRWALPAHWAARLTTAGA
jgi:hypothetical protein